ncbi:hypothetical protein OH76DRAFT_868128 [Lentinus brumalis]|uniref:Uncharacterized protein n=1 Tax=Lentinus brumalis TaxID=2498619 RepID=A0A371DRD5_9APHY|nr:hypothetical protein OH76DRAFT_868128 [Polyporus brumalis]
MYDLATSYATAHALVEPFFDCYRIFSRDASIASEHEVYPRRGTCPGTRNFPISHACNQDSWSRPPVPSVGHGTQGGTLAPSGSNLVLTPFAHADVVPIPDERNLGCPWPRSTPTGKRVNTIADKCPARRAMTHVARRV